MGPIVREALPVGWAPYGGVVVTSNVGMPISWSKIQFGLKAARAQLKQLMESLIPDSASFEVALIALQLSFSAEGQFLGFGGVGAAASITITIQPKPRR